MKKLSAHCLKDFAASGLDYVKRSIVEKRETLPMTYSVSLCEQWDSLSSVPHLPVDSDTGCSLCVRLRNMLPVSSGMVRKVLAYIAALAPHSMQTDCVASQHYCWRSSIMLGVWNGECSVNGCSADEWSWYSAVWSTTCSYPLLDDKRPQTSWTRSHCICAAWFCEVLQTRECRHCKRQLAWVSCQSAVHTLTCNWQVVSVCCLR